MNRYIIYHILTLLAALLVATSAWGQTDRGTLPDPVDTDNSTNTVLSSGIYTLNKDYKPGTDKRWNIKFSSDATEVIVDLNGYTIDASNIDRAVFNVVRGVLTITDSKGGGKIKNSEKSAIYVAPSTSSTTTKATCNFKGGTIENCQPSDDNGGAFDIQPRGTVNMSGGVITGCRGTNGAAVYVKGGTFNMTGGEIKDNKVNALVSWTPPTDDKTIPTTTNTTSSRGGGIYVEAGECTVSGGTISGNVAHSGGGVFVTSGATFSFTGGTIEGNYAVSKLGAGTGNGGGIYIEGGSSNCTINGGTIKNNRATRYGGGININGSTMTIPNCTISGNLASSGGGISMEALGSLLNLEGCTLENNIANVSSIDTNGGGGGVFVVNGILNMSKNNIFRANVTTRYGGGVYLQAGTVVVSGGTSSFTENEADSGGAIYHTKGDITVAEDATLNIGGSSLDNGNIATRHGGGVYCAGTITTEGTTNIMYNSAKTWGGGIYCTGSFISYGNTTIQNNTAVDRAGGIYMTGDAIKLEGNTTNIIANSSGNYAGALYVNNGIISIKGVSRISDNHSKLGGAVYLNNGSMITTGSTTVESNYSTEKGGAIYVLGGHVEMENPTIIGNGINDSQVSTKQGGAIYISGENAGFTATGISNISSNAASKDGGAIYLDGGDVILEENRICYNSAETGGAVYLNKGRLITTRSAYVANNYANTNGGAFYVSNGQVEMENPEIIGNGKDSEGTPITGNGGAIFIQLDQSTQGEIVGFKATGTSIIHSNASTSAGGAICVNYGNVQLARNTISSNFSNVGGAVYVLGGSLTTTDVSIVQDNYSNTDGGAFYVKDGRVEMNNPTITGNGKTGETPKTRNGGAIFVTGEGAGFVATGEELARIEDNAASDNGAAIYVNGGNISFANPTEMLQNKAGKSGGVAYVSNGSVVLSENTTMYQNEAKEGSGGVFYVEKSIDYTGTVGVTTKTGTMQSNKSGANGGVFCVNGGNIDLEGKTTMSQNSAVNGGAIALYNGTFAFADGSEIKANAASGNGGGLYIANNNATSISCQGGSYLNNVAGLCGGGIYASGPITLTFAANVRDNKAQDGGGLYLDVGVNMSFGNGLIVGNSAEKTGGGIYLSKGKLTFTSTQNLGIYNNAASIEAADIYSSGSGTTVDLPNVTGMNLIGFEVPGSDLYWVKDFADRRYETALRNNEDIETMILDFEGSDNLVLTNRQCLDLGYDLVFVTLNVLGLKDGDNAAVTISYPHKTTGNATEYRKIVLAGNKQQIVGLPSNQWQFHATPWSFTYDNDEVYNPVHSNTTDANQNLLKDYIYIKRNHNQTITITFSQTEAKKKLSTYDAIKVNIMRPGGSM